MTYVRLPLGCDSPQGNVGARMVRKGSGDELEVAAVTILQGSTGSRWAAKEEAQAKEESQSLDCSARLGRARLRAVPLTPEQHAGFSRCGPSLRSRREPL